MNLEVRRKFFIDTEFMENGPQWPIDLISIGIVAENGREYYAIDEAAPLHRANKFVKENVIPRLNMAYAKPRHVIAEEILKFVGQKPEFWGYYADYDWVVLCQLYGSMVGLPTSWPMFCLDIKQYCWSLGNPDLPKLEGPEHEALHDAREIAMRYNWLRTYENEQNLQIVEKLRKGQNR